MSQARAPKRHGRSLVGERFTADVGAVAHGGHCVARHDFSDSAQGAQVVFVRHTLPGERVVAVVTEGDEGSRFLRADAVEVVVAAPDRVEPPCPFSGPGRCGGCDFQHVTPAGQRALKAAVVAEQLQRLAGLEVAVEVEPVPGDQEGLRWRTRMQYHRTPDGRLGLRKHRDHAVVPVDDCRIAHPEARVVVDGEPLGGETEPTVESVVTDHGTHSFAVAADGFWQVHPGAPRTLVDAVLDLLEPRPGERAVDLYAGVGLFSAFLAEAVGPTGAVVAVESDRAAAGHAAGNLAAYPWSAVVSDRVDRTLRHGSAGGPCDLVVLDPPRTGAKRQIVERIASMGPRAVAYVACDPAALARDVAIFAESGYRLASLRAFDLFPMTSHVEVVAKLVKSASDVRQCDSVRRGEP